MPGMYLILFCHVSENQVMEHVVDVHWGFTGAVNE